MTVFTEILASAPRYYQLKRSQYWALERSRALARARLEETLDAAWAIPFYAERFGSRPEVGRFDRLPWLKREDIAPDAYATAYFGLLEGLQALFAQPVDLVAESAITNPYFRESVERTRTQLYAA